MKETTRLQGLFADLYNGDPWLDVTLAGTLKGLTAEQAGFRISAERNSIWEIVNHMISWRLAVLKRIHGEMIVSPADNFLTPVENQSSAAWQQTLLRLEDSQKQWLDFLRQFNDAGLDDTAAVNKVSHHKHIHGILQHDAYHLGQIVLLTKLAGSNFST